jgi:tetratricopeptide (TPR) repeat protein
LHADLARVAMAKRDWQAASERWQAVETKFPAYSPTYCDQSFALRMLQRFDEAEAVVLRGLALFPSSESLHAEFARIAMVRQDWPEAMARWEAVEKQFPRHVFAYAEPGQILRQLKRFDEAKAVLQRGLAMLPDAEGLLAELARVTVARGD